MASIAPSGVALSAWRHTERHRKGEGGGHNEAVGYCSQTHSLRTSQTAVSSLPVVGGAGWASGTISALK